MDENTRIFLDGEEVTYRGLQYVMLNKPAGYLSARTDRTDHVVTELLSGLRDDVSLVGRLDRDTEGLLLFTNDGALAHRLLSPKNLVPKTYYLKTDRPIPEGARETLSKPVVFRDFTSAPADLKVISDCEAELTVTEGKFHEVKRLMHHTGCEVVYLKRIAFGPLGLGDLVTGAFRHLTEEEIRSLREI